MDAEPVGEPPSAGADEGDALGPLLTVHGPPSARDHLGPRALAELERGGSTSVHAVVVVGDLRMSSMILKEAVRPALFARFIVGFTEAVRALAHASDGWFDKFTGDGFIAFWMYPPGGDPDIDTLCEFCQTVLPASDSLVQNLRRNSRNFPTAAGLALGIDSGACELVRVGGALTLVGSPVVGATRMVACAPAQDALVNLQLGTHLEAESARLASSGISLERTVARTKEYPEGQEAYRLRFGLAAGERIGSGRTARSVP
ncbi:MAG TPA: hypothetical protein VEY07_06015 [Thermoplasmata archaeon]|nr:hypothetical protein [Thermoplasmata archaeon]